MKVSTHSKGKGKMIDLNDDINNDDDNIDGSSDDDNDMGTYDNPIDNQQFPNKKNDDTIMKGNYTTYADMRNNLSLDDIFKEVLNMKFDSIEAADSFCNMYTQCVGFSARKSDKKGT